MPKLFHVSEDPAILAFDPRMPPSAGSGVQVPVVWAVDEEHLHNYLLPRDCPRVTFYVREKSRREDVEALMGNSTAKAVVAVEAAWVERIRATTLYLYLMPDEAFEVQDEGAGYWIARQTIVPTAKRQVSDCFAAIQQRGVEIRIMESLWELHERVIASSLHFSCIRMRNARPR